MPLMILSCEDNKLKIYIIYTMITTLTVEQLNFDPPRLIITFKQYSLQRMLIDRWTGELQFRTC